MKNDLTCRLAMKGSVIILAGLFVFACQPQTATDQSVTQSKSEEAGQAPEDAMPPDSTIGVNKPQIAFQISSDLYAVPLAVDKDGCEQFTTWSESGVKSLAQPIYFHDGEGAFSPTKIDGASCNASMIQTGVDDEGCPTFRAEQPDGTSSEVVYYASSNGYTIRKERSDCK